MAARRGADLVLRLLISRRLARYDQTNSSRPDGRIFGHSRECMARSCLEQSADGNSSHPTTDRRMWDADIHDKIRELNLFRAILLLR